MKKILSFALVMVLLASTAVTSTAVLTQAERDRLPVFRQDRNGIYYIVDRNIQQFMFTVPTPYVQMVYGTIRIFVQYGYVVDRNGNIVPQDWLIQFWKGRNGEFLGTEIGVFYKPSSQAAQHFLPVTQENTIGIEISTWQHDFASGQTRLLFTRSQSAIQWMTGFVRGGFHDPQQNNRGKSEVITTGVLTLPSRRMAQLVANQLVEAGFTATADVPTHQDFDSVALRGNSIYFTWQYIDQDVPSHRRGIHPAPPQPRQPIVLRIVQRSTELVRDVLGLI
jgi:hypothetical protein